MQGYIYILSTFVMRIVTLDMSCMPEMADDLTCNGLISQPIEVCAHMVSIKKETHLVTSNE
jgi:hypothetical protein